MTCMAGSSDAVLVGVRQQGQEAGTLDGRVQLALVDRAGAGEAGRDDLAVFADEVTQRVDVLVVDLFDAGDGEAAEALALEQQRLRVALGALVFVEFLERGHFGASYRKLILLKILDVQNRMLGRTWCGEKALESPETSQRLPCEPFGIAAKGDGLQGR